LQEVKVQSSVHPVVDYSKETRDSATVPHDQLDQQVQSIEPPSVEESSQELEQSSQESCDSAYMPPDQLDTTVITMDQMCTSLQEVAKLALKSVLTQNNKLIVTFHQLEGNDELVTGLHQILDIQICRVQTSEKETLLRDLNKIEPHGIYVVNCPNDHKNKLAFTMEMNDYIAYVHFTNQKKAGFFIIFHIIMNAYLVVCICS
jgi:hypothetical protein